VTGRRILWWFLLPLLTFGAATFAVVGYAGWQLRSRWHFAAAAGYFLLFMGFFIGAQFTGEEFGVVDAITLPLFLVNWLVGSAHAGWVERRIKAKPSTAKPTSPADPAVLVAQQRLHRRNEARALLTSHPALAAELRIGRPDLRRHYDDGGLVTSTTCPPR